MATEIRSTVVLTVPEDISGSAAAQLSRDLNECLSANPGSVNLDCSQLNRVTADHISSLCGAYRTCVEAGVAVRLESLPPGLVRVLSVLGLDELYGGNSEPGLNSRGRAFRWAAEGFRRMHVDQFRGDIRDVNRSSATFLNYLKSLKLSEIAAFELQTVFYEIAMNIAAHGNTATDERIVFTAEADDAGIVMAFTDSGDPFDPTEHEVEYEPQSAGRERRKRGLGITMIRRLMDKITYCRKHETINVLTVEKNWGS